MANSRWTDVFVERRLTEPMSRIDECLSQPGLPVCLDLYRVEFVAKRTSADGRRRLYHFRAPDAESVRQVFRRTRTAIDAILTSAPDGYWPTPRTRS